MLRRLNERSFGPAVFFTILLTLVAIAAFAACSSPNEEGASEEELSAVRQAQMATRVYRKLVGRDPTPAEIGQLRTATLAQMVDTVLASPDFKRDGFFGYQRDRLLLHRDGDEGWLKASLPDYCALKLDLEEVARADADGGGYYEILRYRDRYVPLSQAALGVPLGCMTSKVGDLKRAVLALDTQSPPPTDGGVEDAGVEEAAAPEPIPAVAQTCAQYIRFREPFRTELLALDASVDDTPVASTAPAVKLMKEGLSQSLFRPMWSMNPQDPQPEPIEIVLDGGGKPFLRGFDKLPNERCNTVDALTSPILPSTPGQFGGLVEHPLYLKVRVPAPIEGVHGSMYWLSRHGSTKKNRDLHRARLVFFSYMCTEISPAMAAIGGGDPQPIDELVPYFDPEDEHVRTSANCYNCHTQVQPVANYFGELTKGASYAGDQVGGGFGGFAMSYYQQGDGFRRPGGLWKGDAFHPNGAGKFGMEGLADLLSDFEPGHDCITKNAWGSMIGSGYPLTDEERAAAIAAFKGDGTYRFANLLRHLAVENKRGKAFFEGGEAALAAVRPESSPDCRDVPAPPEDALGAPDGLLMNACSGCHSGTNNRSFYERVTEDGVTRRVWKPERLVTQPGGPPGRYEHIAQLYDRAYCRVWNGDMPMGGWDEGDGVSADVKKKQALCYFGGKRNEAARASDDPNIKALDSRPCEGQAIPNPPNGAPHPVNP